MRFTPYSKTRIGTGKKFRKNCLQCNIYERKIMIRIKRAKNHCICEGKKVVEEMSHEAVTGQR